MFVVLRGLAFVGAGTAHAAFAGVALGYFMGWPPLLLAIIFGLATVWITGWVEEKGRMKLDVSIGILYTTTMALAILFIGLMKTYNAEVYGYLFGSVLSVTSEELRTIGGLSILVLGLDCASFRKNCTSSPSIKKWPRPPACRPDAYFSSC